MQRECFTLSAVNFLRHTRNDLILVKILFFKIKNILVQKELTNTG